MKRLYYEVKELTTICKVQYFYELAKISLSLLLLLPADNFMKSLVPDQDPQNVAPNLDPNHLTL